MPDGPNSTAPGTPPPAQSGAATKPAPPEKFDRSDSGLPRIVPAIIGVAVVALIAGFFIMHRPKPTASGEIVKVVGADQSDNVVVAVQIKFTILNDQRLWVRSISSELETTDGKKYPDSSIPGSDMDRYIQAFPALAEAKAPPLREDLKIPGGSPFTGMAVFAYPVKKSDFDARKSLTLKIGFYDRPPLVLKQ